MVLKIVAAAVQFYPDVDNPHRVLTTVSAPPPARHANLLAAIPGERVPPAGQGFLTSEGTFVDRVRAAIIAQRAGQVTTLIAPPNLYSEDLW
jgi:hypothetical protein